MTPKEILIAARQKITPPQCWTQGESARNIHNEPTAPDSLGAVCWCAIGACEAVSSDRFVVGGALTQLNRHVRGTADFNDTHTHQEVLALFDKAIAAAP